MRDSLKVDFRMMIGLFFITFSTMLLELNLIKLFDVILTPNFAYMVISSAIFSFGLGGIFLCIRPIQYNPLGKLQILAIFYGLAVLAQIFILNHVPFDFTRINNEPLSQIIYITVFYLFLIIPFFLGGVIIATVFSELPSRSQTLYFFDLSGAAIGSIILAPILPQYGPGGVFLIVCALCFLAAMMFSRLNILLKIGFSALIVILIAYPLIRNSYIEIKGHWHKRGVIEAKEKGQIEYTRWDPVSKIEIINRPGATSKHIAYDGGNQSSYFYNFDGDFEELRKRIEKQNGKGDFWGKKVLVSHYLKQNSGSKVLVIGSAGGQEIKAALAFNAAKVDAVELVGTVIKLGKNRYSNYIGNIFNNPKVSLYHEEGRSFIRSRKIKYDIIQIFSNHTSSSIAAGNSAIAPIYLQTVEAYKEYFGQLKSDGILHVNHHYYPRMMTTASRAWKEMGKSNFPDHAVVLESPEGTYSGSLPTLLIKMSPWSEEEIQKIAAFMEPEYRIVFNPFQTEANLLPVDLFGDDQEDMFKNAEFRLYPATDDRPYFSFIRKKFKKLDFNSSPFLDWGTANLTNQQLKGIVSLDSIHLIVVGLLSLVFAVLFTLIPLKFSSVGKEKWSGKFPVLIYFSCLGLGFIIFELTFIQIFMQLIGYPVYTYSVVVFGLLLSASIGSLLSTKVGLTRGNRWYFVFIAIIVIHSVFTLIYPAVFSAFQGSSISVRISVGVLLILPLGLFLGIPFPMGIGRLEKETRGAIAWAWGMNGIFTVIGGLLSVVLSLFFGFRICLFIAVFIYLIAFLTFFKVDATNPQNAD